jgi:hypothetical protein
MDRSDEVKHEHKSFDKNEDDDSLEIMVDESTIEFVNRSTTSMSTWKREEKLSIISDPVSDSEKTELTKEAKALRNKNFRNKMREKIRKERDECKALGKVFDKRRNSRGKKWKQRGIERRKKGLPMGRPRSVD